MTQASTLVVGATGATGRLLVEELLQRGVRVRAVVRPSSRLPEHLDGREGLTVVPLEISQATEVELAELVTGCDAIASCLGHRLSFRGIFGKPRRLVTQAVVDLCRAASRAGAEGPVRFVLMNTAGNRNRNLEESVSRAQRLVVGLIRLLIPPHADNEDAADALRQGIGQDDPRIEWSVVRPDGLIDEEQVTTYEVHDSPTRSAIFDPGRTSRIHVAHFMAALMTDDALWARWRGRMPVIYDAAEAAPASSPTR